MTKFVRHYSNIFDKVLEGLPMFIASSINIILILVGFALVFWLVTGISLI